MKKIELAKRENVVNFYRKSVRDVARAVKPNGLILGEFKLLMHNLELKNIGYQEKNGIMSKWEFLQLSEILATTKKMASSNVTDLIKQAEHAKKMAFTLLEHTF